MTALARSLGTTFETFDTVKRSDCPLTDDELIAAATAGLLPLRQGGRLIWILEPRRLMARDLASGCEPPWLDRYRLTSSACLRHFVERHTQRALGRRATDSLRRKQPLFSNAPRRRSRPVTRIAAALLAPLLILSAPLVAIESLSALLCTLFLAAALLRLWCACRGKRGTDDETRPSDQSLPIYTIICALYREANVVDDLVAAIRALDYPPEKLDIKFVLEADDKDTKRAIDGLRLGPSFHIIVAPSAGPRTKPKALNAALPFARGDYVVVYDAEDAPEPGQLRKAVATFRRGGKRLVCLQASLTIYNYADTWLTRMFTVDYAGQFDAFLPGLAAMQFPFPLGGSSNHFRTAFLRRAGGWDPYNVTEDADLGIRMFRLGYRSSALASVTSEEAPVRFSAWLKQRSRWYKGWIQTWLVHMRRPYRLWRELGPGGFLAFQIFFAANVLAALIHPLFMAGLGCTLLAWPAPWAKAVLNNAAPIFAVSLLSGYATAMLLDLVGLRRRGRLDQGWVLLLMPLHWLLLSLAGWRALIQLLHDPQRWEKTEHGLAKTSRIAGAKTLAVAKRNQIGPAAPIAPIGLMQTRREALRRIR